MRITEINQRKLITESWNDPKLSLLESRVIIPFVEDIERYIVEAQLSPDQISQLFTSAEQGMTAGGKNRTAIGKGKDAAGAGVDAIKGAATFIDGKINELGRALQKAGPVQNADAKFKELKAKIGATDSKVAKAIQGVSDWAKENPGKASIAVGILTTAAAMAGGPMGGAVAGFLARATKDLLQGADLSTAVGKSIKTAAYGALAGAAFKYISDNIIDNIASADAAELADMQAGLKDANYINAKADILSDIGQPVDVLDNAMRYNATGNVNSFYFNYDTVVPPDMQGQFEAARGAMDAAKLGTKEFYTAAAKFHDFMGSLQNSAEAKNLTAAWDAIKQIPKDALTAGQTAELLAQANSSEALISAIEAAGTSAASVVQGALATVDDNAKKAQQAKPIDPAEKKELEAGAEQKESKKLTNLQIETLIEWCDDTPEVLTEGPLDALKKAGSAVGGALKKGAAAVGAKAAQVGKNITTKVTADKLNKAWNKAGKPTDSDEIANILRQAGVSDDVLTPIYKQFGAKLPPVPKPAEKPAASKAQPAAQAGAEPKAQAGAEPKAQAAQAGAEPNAQAAQGSGQPAAEPTDFKGIQQAVAKLNPQQKQELIKHIDSLGAQTPAAGNNAAQPAQGTAPTGNAPANAKTAPAQGTAPTGNAPANAKTAPAADKNAAAGDTYEKAKGDIRKVQGGSKPMPPKTAANIDAALAKLAKGDKESGVWAAQRIMNFAKAGVDVSKQQQAWIANSKAGERFLTQSTYFEISSMLREHGLRWSDLGLRVHLLEGTNAYIGISQL